jgi:hypothetical protein
MCAGVWPSLNPGCSCGTCSDFLLQVLLKAVASWCRSTRLMDLRAGVITLSGALCGLLGQCSSWA